MIKLTLITNDPALAQSAVQCGVGRIFVDLEILGKKERQGHLDTRISSHCMADVREVRRAVPDTELLVRLNPYHSGSAEEIEEAIKAGADLLMLPMFTRTEEVALFCTLVGGRVGVVPLLETPQAMGVLPEIVRLPQVVEVYIGLNDLHLGLGLDFMFEPLENGMVESMANVIKQAGLPFGFGGIARVGEGLLPGELVLAEHVRLGSSSVLLSRTFHQEGRAGVRLEDPGIFGEEVRKLREAEATARARTPGQIEHDRVTVKNIIASLVRARRMQKCS